MIAANDYWRTQFTIPYLFIERQFKAMAVAQPDPANPCRQPLKIDVSFRLVRPCIKRRIIRHQFANFPIGWGVF